MRIPFERAIVLLVIYCLGLLYTMYWIRYNLWLHKEFHRYTWRFASQYSTWKKFFQTEQSTQQIYDGFQNDEERNKIFINQGSEVHIYYTSKKFKVCKTTREIVECLAKGGEHLEKLNRKLLEPKVKFRIRQDDYLQNLHNILDIATIYTLRDKLNEKKPGKF